MYVCSFLWTLMELVPSLDVRQNSLSGDGERILVKIPTLTEMLSMFGVGLLLSLAHDNSVSVA